MAKIALITKNLTSTSWQLALALKAQQHEVLILTSRGEEVPPGDLQVWSYFKSWSALEAFRLLPRLFMQQIQIMHLVLHEDRLNAGQAVLSAFARSHPQCILTTSLLHIKRGLKRSNPVRYLIEESDIVTCPTTESMGHLRGLNVRSTRQGRGILPPILNLHESLNVTANSTETSLDLPKDLKIENAVVFPLRETYFDKSNKHLNHLKELHQKHPVLLWGSFQDWTLRDRKGFEAWMKQSGSILPWAVTGQLDLSQLQALFKNVKALFLAGLDLTPHELTDYYLKAIHNHLALVIDDRQARLHADLWKNGVNCWILRLDSFAQDLHQWLNKTEIHLPESLSENLMRNRHLMDSSLNELNRLYNRALVHLR